MCALEDATSSLASRRSQNMPLPLCAGHEPSLSFFPPPTETTSPPSPADPGQFRQALTTTTTYPAAPPPPMQITWRSPTQTLESQDPGQPTPSASSIAGKVDFSSGSFRGSSYMFLSLVRVTHDRTHMLAFPYFYFFKGHNKH